MKSEDMAEIIRVLGISWGTIAGAVAIVFKWLSVLPEKWREQSLGRTAILRLEDELLNFKDQTSESFDELEKKYETMRKENSENWIEFLKIAKQKSL